jgi:hypothetical protein
MMTHVKNMIHAKKTIIVHIASQNVHTPSIATPFLRVSGTKLPQTPCRYPPGAVHGAVAAALEIMLALGILD